ncbi:hypothetical protein BDU57DRAFT_94570 [Ampelomyces quisqualis]|uniref:Uncharacterized protein n=1 Tax=Ampelomyces quisqualis TaxID=50730 RepID=A0A6A5Q7Y4_AMPQU|nr:hypothetical protein BDU57DRAFT_94570 [Ampelomyces quisqualis]
MESSTTGFAFPLRSQTSAISRVHLPLSALCISRLFAASVPCEAPSLHVTGFPTSLSSTPLARQDRSLNFRSALLTRKCASPLLRLVYITTSRILSLLTRHITPHKF